MNKLSAVAIGIRRSKEKKVLDVYFPLLTLTKDAAVSKIEKNKFNNISDDVLEELKNLFNTNLDIYRSFTSSTQHYATTSAGYFFLDRLDEPIKSTEEAYLKLQLISKRIVKPHEINLEGLFGILNNIAWSNKGPILPEDLDEVRLKYIATDQPLEVSHVDKFPYLVNYHVPSGVRIASGSQVRLGAYLGEGTTIMPAGYVNFNAGTLGQAMIEGRVSAGVVVGDKSDVGGGASIMGTLSGGNKTVISIGAQCLLGANAGTGISLGNGCTIAAGLYVTAGMPIYLVDKDNNPINLEGEKVQEPNNCVKAADLSGKDYLLFIQDSKSGKTICKPNQKVIELNTSLHVN